MDNKVQFKKVLIVGLALILLMFFVDRTFYSKKVKLDEENNEDREEIGEGKNENMEEEEMQGEYVEFRAEIKSVNEENGKMSLLVEDENEEMIFHIDDRVKIFDMKASKESKIMHLKEGAEISAFYSKNTPVAMSIPGQLTPELIVVRNNEEFMDVKMDLFDEDLLSSDGKLKLNIEDESLIEDYKDKVLLVYYDATTRSIPAQTSPEIVIIIE